MKRAPAKLEDQLDRIFSKWVRFSNAPKGYCRCVTCGKIDAPEMMDAGHYISRANRCTRWDERNVWPQCRSCNRFKEGAKDAYALFLTKKFGTGVLEELNRAKNQICKMGTPWLEESIKDYKARVKALPKV